MKEQVTHSTESKPRLSIDLINGYYLSFLAIGLLTVIIKVDITNDLKQVLFFIFLCLLFGSIDLFKSASEKESRLDEIRLNPQTVVYGSYYDRVESIVSNTSNQQNTDIKLDTPSNYFDVIKTIEIVPNSPDPNKKSIRDVLVEFQSYIESDYALTLSEKEAILEVIKGIAIEARLNPANEYLIYIVELSQKIDRNMKFKTSVINALKSASMIEPEPHSSNYIKILTAFFSGYRAI